MRASRGHRSIRDGRYQRPDQNPRSGGQWTPLITCPAVARSLHLTDAETFPKNQLCSWRNNGHPPGVSSAISGRTEHCPDSERPESDARGRETHSAASAHIPRRHSRSRIRRLPRLSRHRSPSLPVSSQPPSRPVPSLSVRVPSVPCLTVRSARGGSIVSAFRVCSWTASADGGHLPGIQMQRKAPLSSRHVPSF